MEESPFTSMPYSLTMPPTPRAVSRPPRWVRKMARSPGAGGAGARPGAPLRQVTIQGSGGLGSERPLALLFPLAAHPDQALGAIDILQIQPYQFAHANAAAIEK